MITGKAKMPRKMDTAIAALLTAPTIAIAAQAVGISEQTLWRWLQNSEFQEKYRQAKREAIAQAVARSAGYYQGRGYPGKCHGRF